MSLKYFCYVIILTTALQNSYARTPGKNIIIDVMPTKGLKKGIKKTLTLPWDATSYDISDAYLKSFKRDLRKHVDCQVLKGDKNGKHTGISDIYTFRETAATPGDGYVGLLCDLKDKSCGCDD